MSELSAEVVAKIFDIIDGVGRGVLYGVYRGYVMDNKDPLGLGRLKLYIPIIHGGVCPDVDGLVWASPCSIFGGGNERGQVLIPDVGTTVWVMFEAGQTEYPVWLGVWWGVNEVPVYQDKSDFSLKRHILYRYFSMFFESLVDGSNLKLGLNDDCFIELDKDFLRFVRGGDIIEMRDDYICLKTRGGAKIELQGENVVFCGE